MRKLLFVLCFIFISITSMAQSTSNLHPRLWVRVDDLDRLRSWANDDNPLWVQLFSMAQESVALMDSGTIPQGDLGGVSYEEFPTENHAVLLAFVSLVHPDESVRLDYARRSRTLLMHVLDQALLGEDDAPFRQNDFPMNDRSRWYGLGFPLTVDWIYPVLSEQDKATIRTVFIRWNERLQVADMTTNNHPEPQGVVNDPILLADRSYARWSNNNYYTAHMRNMGLMAMALDPADDPNGTLTSYLSQATGAWLYVVDAMMRTDVAGGMGAEGIEYSPQTVGYVAQLLLALFTANLADTAQLGQQVVFENNAYWDDSITAYLHSLSPRTIEHEYRGQVYLPAWYGSGQNYHMPDYIESFGAIGVYDALTGNQERLNAIRWIQLHTAPGGADGLIERLDFEQFHYAILYFMLFDPTAPAPTDPRATLDTTFFAPGIGRLLSRTDWTENATWFTYTLGWNQVDHQSGNGNSIEFYRNGEWLTKVRVGYDLDYISSDNLNTITVQNGRPSYDDYRGMLWQRGSQWLYGSNEPQDPIIDNQSAYLYARGDSTELYNSDYEDLHDVTHVSREVVWIRPDTIIVYDRAQTVSDGQVKQFHLNLPYSASTSGNLSTMTTPSGQVFTIQTLLPVDGIITVREVPDEVSSSPAETEMMDYRLTVEALNAPQRTRFLHVLHASDSASTQTATYLSETRDGIAYEGVQIGGIRVLFAVDMGQPAVIEIQ